MNKDIQRSFILGEEWLYYKVYTGPNTADFILGNIVKPITDNLLKKGWIDKWFFIRYADPKEHLRIRFHLTHLDYLGKIVLLITPHLKDLIHKDLIWKIQTDTYHREIERYGANTIVEAESLFFYDSIMISTLISMIEGDEGEEIRWLFGLKAIDNLLDSFRYTETQKIELLHNLKVNFRSEFHESKTLNNQIKDKYRDKRKEIEGFMTVEASNMTDYQPLFDILNEKCTGISSVVESIFSKEHKKDLNDLLASYIHMLMNRLFKSKNRIHEMICYDFLHRYYMSERARKKV